MNLRRYIDMAVRRELRRHIDGPRNINRVVGKFYALLRAYKPTDSYQQGAVEEAMDRIRRIPDQMESGAGEIRAHRSMDRIDMLFTRTGIYKGSSGHRISGLFGDLLSEMVDYDQRD